MHPMLNESPIAQRKPWIVIDIFAGDDGVTYYTVENEAWGDVDDPDAWNIGYAQFICTADQLVHLAEPDR